MSTLEPPWSPGLGYLMSHNSAESMVLLEEDFNLHESKDALQGRGEQNGKERNSVLTRLLNVVNKQKYN